MPPGLIPAHKQSVVLFLERVYGMNNKDLFFSLLEDAFLPDLRAATALDKVRQNFTSTLMLKSYYSFDGKILRLHQYQTLTISLTAKSYLTDAKYYFIDEKNLVALTPKFYHSTGERRSLLDTVQYLQNTLISFKSRFQT